MHALLTPQLPNINNLGQQQPEDPHTTAVLIQKLSQAQC